MIGDFLTDGADLIPATPPRFDGECHFRDRALERGVVSIDPLSLMVAIYAALVYGREDVIELVFELDDGAVAYRVLLPEGPFYPVVRAGTKKLLTIYDHGTMRKVRDTRRKSKKYKGQRKRRWVSGAR